MCLVQESELQAQIAANGAVIDELRADARKHIESTLRKEEEFTAAQASMWYVDGMNSSCRQRLCFFVSRGIKRQQHRAPVPF